MTKECRTKPPEITPIVEEAPAATITVNHYYDDLNYDVPEPLPQTEWLVCYDYDQQSHSYYHQKYRLTTWTLPREVRDLFYDYNLNYSKSLWHITRPQPIHPWDVFLTENGEVYYYNCNTEESSWYPPSGEGIAEEAEATYQDS